MRILPPLHPRVLPRASRPALAKGAAEEEHQQPNQQQRLFARRQLNVGRIGSEQ